MNTFRQNGKGRFEYSEPPFVCLHWLFALGNTLGGGCETNHGNSGSGADAAVAKALLIFNIPFFSIDLAVGISPVLRDTITESDI